MKITRCSPALGARVEGLDLSKPLDPAVVEALKQAWRDHQVLVFPSQDLTTQQQVAFAHNFGELVEHPMTAKLPAPRTGPRAEARAVIATDSTVDANQWHSDISFMEVPPAFSLLFGRQVVAREDVDDDTCFSNQYTVYEALSPGLRQFLDSTSAWHTGKGILQDMRNRLRANESLKKDEKKKEPEAADPFFGVPLEQLHPCARRHPETGKVSLYVGFHRHTFTDRFDGWTHEESQPLLQQLEREAEKPEHVYRHQWRKGDLVCWDNRCVMHRGPPTKTFPKGVTRSMVRATVTPVTEIRPQPPASSAKPGSSRL